MSGGPENGREGSAAVRIPGGGSGFCCCGVQESDKGNVSKKKEEKKDQLRCLMDESIFFFFRTGRGGFFSFCHSKSKRNKEFWREIPFCRRLPRV